MADVLFYHLTGHRLEQALPLLLERCLERDWRVVVQTSSPMLCERLDHHLWAYRADSFLPHSREGAFIGEEGDHPVWLTTRLENPNQAKVRFMVEGAIGADANAYERLVYMFDGHDMDAVAGARERWKIEKQAGHTLTYWQQNEEGKWQKKG